jgi:hypothetical protein
MTEFDNNLVIYNAKNSLTALNFLRYITSVCGCKNLIHTETNPQARAQFGASIGNWWNQLSSGNAYVAGQTTATVASLFLGADDISVAVGKAGKAESLLGKAGMFTKSIAVSSAENAKNLLTLPGRTLDNLGNSREALSQGNNGLRYAFASAGDGRSVLSMAGRDADVLPKNEVQMNFIKEMSQQNKVEMGATESSTSDLSKGNANDFVEGGSNPEISRIDYLRNKFGKMTSEELNSEINKPGLRRIIGNESPSDVAQSWQGGDPYFGVDTYRDIKLKPGKVIYAGEPNPTGYLTTKSGIDRVGNDATKIFEGLQVKPFYKEGMDNAIYRNTMMAYEPTVELDGVFGIAKANPQFGTGKLPQIFIDNFNELVHNGYLKKLPEKAIELQNFKMSYEDYEQIVERIIELGGKGY